MNVAIIGLQWGDEGKGKVVDLLAQYFDVVARYQGGHNAGHTVYRNGQRYVVHHIPAGIFHDHTQVVLGNGMVIDAVALMDEIHMLESIGIRWRRRLWISDRAHLITPLHRCLEQIDETLRGHRSIGTTRRGIGPAYEDKYGRRGFLAGYLVDDTWQEVLDTMWQQWRQRSCRVSNDPHIHEEWTAFRERLHAIIPHLREAIIQTDVWLRKRIAAGARVLFEGAQGTLLDIDHGTYPFVTSSSCSVGGIVTGLGISPRAIHRVLGVSKAYCTRVGGGPFPTELHDTVGEQIRTRGQEFGATTGRPRRCGWLDLVALKYACDLNDVDGIVLTKLDILDTFETIRVCVAYRLDGKRIETCPVRADVLARVEPIYECLPGWQRVTYGTTDVQNLPPNARAYIRTIEEYTGRPVVLLSSGPQRHESAWFRPIEEILGIAP